MNFIETLTEKRGPLPTWAWAALGTLALGLLMYQRNKKNAANPNTQAAANLSNGAANTASDLGSAQELANLFTVAGLMPYQGGNVYVNTAQAANGSSAAAGNPATSNNNPPPGHSKGSPAPKPKPKPVTNHPAAWVTVKEGDTLSSIARRYGLTWQQLYNYNITTGSKGANRNAAAIATLKKRGPDTLVRGESIAIPKKGLISKSGGV